MTTMMSTICIQVASFVKIICFYYLAKWNTMQTKLEISVLCVHKCGTPRVHWNDDIQNTLFLRQKKKIPRDKFIGCVYLLFWQYQNTNFKINWMHTVRVRFNDISRKYISSLFTSLLEKKIHHTRILKFRKVFLSDFITRKYVGAILEM